MKHRNKKYHQENYVYLDYQSTTPCDPRCTEAMLPYLGDFFGNPHSTDHIYGWMSSTAVEESLHRLAIALSCNPAEIVLTSGATEANNLAIKGLTNAPICAMNKIVVCAIDHKSVIEAANRQKKTQIEVCFAPVDSEGIIDLNFLEDQIRKSPALVSVGLVNSELGVIQPIEDIIEVCHQHHSLVHTDASQAIGRCQFDFFELDIDLVSLSGHKIYGPKGIGALLIKNELQSKISPLIDGGGQQNNLRSGTIPTFLAVGLGVAVEIAQSERLNLQSSVGELRDFLQSELCRLDPKARLNGALEQKIYGNINITFSDTDAQELLMRTASDIGFSTSSACAGGAVQPSHVLQAIGLDDDQIRRTIRLCVGDNTSQEDVVRAVEVFSRTLMDVRR